MKRISKILLFGFFLFLLHGCDPKYAFTECDYEYSVNIKNLKDTIKTTDTLWVENDFDPHFCLKEGIVKNEVIEENPCFMILVDDSLFYYTPEIIGYDRKWENMGNTFYGINIKGNGGRYKSHYGIVFLDTGIYLLTNFGGFVMSKEYGTVDLNGYFNMPTNNIYLLPANLQKEYYSTVPYRYYFIAVVE